MSVTPVPGATFYETSSVAPHVEEVSKKCNCYGVTSMQFRIFLGIFTGFVAAVAVGFAIAGAFTTQNLLSNQCYALVSPVYPSGEALRGMLQCDGSNRWFKWNAQYSNLTSTVISRIALLGPRPTFEEPGPLATDLCGGSSPQNCADGTAGTANVIYPGASSTSNLIAAIRDNPTLYTFIAYPSPSTAGALEVPLGMSAGIC
jgi:hypothetical protein